MTLQQIPTSQVSEPAESTGGSSLGPRERASRASLASRTPDPAWVQFVTAPDCWAKPLCSHTSLSEFVLSRASLSAFASAALIEHAGRLPGDSFRWEVRRTSHEAWDFDAVILALSGPSTASKDVQGWADIRKKLSAGFDRASGRALMVFDRLSLLPPPSSVTVEPEECTLEWLRGERRLALYIDCDGQIEGARVFRERREDGSDGWTMRCSPIGGTRELIEFWTWLDEG